MALRLVTWYQGRCVYFNRFAGFQSLENINIPNPYPAIVDRHDRLEKKSLDILTSMFNVVGDWNVVVRKVQMQGRLVEVILGTEVEAIIFDDSPGCRVCLADDWFRRRNKHGHSGSADISQDPCHFPILRCFPRITH